MMKSNQRGASLIEVIVAFGILAIVTSSTSFMVLQLKKRVQQVITKRSSSIQFENLANAILANPKLFKVNFDPSEAAMCASLATALPLAWDKTAVYDVANCSWCKGRIGYVIQPLPISTIRGVYLATFRVYHPEDTQNSTATCNSVSIAGVRQFQMIVGLKQ